MTLLRIPFLLLACGTPEPASPPIPVETTVQRCLYVNSFSRAEECKEYSGAAWTAELAGADCAAPMPGAAPGTLEGEACDRTSILGECRIDEGGENEATLVFPGVPGDSCSGLSLGCGFSGGTFVPSEACEGEPVVDPPSTVFKPFEQVCVDPLPNEPAGTSAGGQVCTWEAISASTEEGRYYADYADCTSVVSQRPYYPASAPAGAEANDPRLTDPDWVAEYTWVTEQVEASACVCCHTQADAPNGQPSGWYLEAAPIWTETLDDDGMAMMAGWVDSTAFGAFDPSVNNGFSRDAAGVPTTDSARMVAFFEGELARRGFVEADFSTTPPFGGPLYDQLQYQPTACASGVGVGPDGTVTWVGGDARYVYVLEADANPPGVPPNLDLPAGTRWRVDVAYDAEPIGSGIPYGASVAGASQRWPETGAPEPLTPGSTYFLYVLADIYVPVTRCLFTAP